MRITFVCPPLNNSGGNRVVATYARRLRDRGHDVTVVASRNRVPTWFQQLRHRVRHGCQFAVAEDRSEHFEREAVAVKLTEKRRPVCDDDVPDGDVVIATWWKTAEWVAALNPRKGVKVYFIQGLETFAGQPIERVEATYRLPMHRIVISPWLAEQLRQHYGIEGTTLVCNSCDLDRFDAPARGKQARPTVGYIHASNPIKGADRAVAALREVARRVADLRICSFATHAPGDDPPLPAGAEFDQCPSQQRIRDIYAACDVWLSPSRSEGFGLPTLEAMACRTPMVSTPTGAAAMLAAGGGGLIVPHDDTDAMARAIEQVLRMDDAVWRRMSDAAHATAHAYTWEDATDRFEAALHDALNAAEHAKV